MGRGYNVGPSPPRDYGRRRDRSPSPRGRYGSRSRDQSTSLLVRNLRRDCRAEDLRRPFGKFGRLKDIYMPRDYYTGEPRGFGFIQFYDPNDAADAKDYMDGRDILGREITVVFAEENRKKPSQMRVRERVRGRSYDRRSRSPRYSHSRSPRRSRSPRGRSWSCSSSYRSPSPRRNHHFRSPSPRDRKHHERSYSRSPSPVDRRSKSPVEQSPRRRSKRSRSPEEDSPRRRSRSPEEGSPRSRRSLSYH